MNTEINKVFTPLRARAILKKFNDQEQMIVTLTKQVEELKARLDTVIVK